MADLFWRMKREPSHELRSIRSKIIGHVYESLIDPLNNLDRMKWPGSIENISMSMYPFADGQSKAIDLFSTDLLMTCIKL